MKNNRFSGFTLVEVMIVVVIIGILASIAYPSYREHVTRTRRSDAQTALMEGAAQQEKYFAECTHYAQLLTGTRACGTSGASFGDGILNYSTTSRDGHYTISVTAGNITGGCTAITCGFTMTATPVTGGLQDGDGALRVDAVGRREWNRKGAGTWVSWTAK